jgi:DNA-binding CsgD family transcriptional regulator/PAS domain-containing protein
MGRDYKIEGQLLDLVGDIYDCAIEPSRWPNALERITRSIDGAFAAISLHDTAKAGVRLQAHWNVPDEFETGMRENFAINPLVPSVWYADIDRPFTALGEIAADELQSSRWFQTAVAPYGVLDAAMTVLAKSSHRFGALSIFREERKADFDSDAVELLGHIAPHIRRAVMIADLLDTRALERDMLSTTLEMLAVGIVLTDETGRMVHANHAALRHLDDARALRRDRDRLSARDPKAAIELRQAIADAASGSTIDIPRTGISVPVGDLAAWVLPLDGGLRGEFAANFSAKAVVFIREIGDTQPLPAELFVRRYGITPAECRLLVLLAQGMTITEAAKTLGVALTTAKTHLAHLFQKTGTQRQAELVRLALNAFAPAAARLKGHG